ncbi:MAG: hypothetical protein OXN27_16745 [Candidatus Poribacteria bacterium]|nr:hypothetical protein [Candidatus Poribacteria bacterium]
MEIKRRNVVCILVLLIMLSASPFFDLQASPIVLERSITWVPAGDQWDPSQKALVRTEFNEGISYGSKEYTGPQTVQALMHTFDEAYNRKHSRTIATVFSKASIAEIKPDQIMGIHKWSELLSKKGISSSFKGTEIDARYPRTAWLQLLLERGITIESLIDYFFCMAHRHQLAFLEDSPHLWKTEIHGIPSTEAWETYKADYIDRFVRYYTRNWKIPAEVTVKRIETTKARIAASKARVAASKARAEASKSSKRKADHEKWDAELAEMDLQSLQNLVDQLEQIVASLERQNSQKATEPVKELLERAKEALERAKTVEPSPNKPKRNMKKTSRYPPL